MSTSKIFTNKWFVSKSAVKGNIKKPTGVEYQGYFYTGPTLNFGHVTKAKK